TRCRGNVFLYALAITWGHLGTEDNVSQRPWRELIRACTRANSDDSPFGLVGPLRRLCGERDARFILRGLVKVLVSRIIVLIRDPCDLLRKQRIVCHGEAETDATMRIGVVRPQEDVVRLFGEAEDANILLHLFTEGVTDAWGVRKRVALPLSHLLRCGFNSGGKAILGRHVWPS